MAKVRGLDVYIKVNTGTYGTPVWTKVGGQKDATATFTLGEVDVTDKDSTGWGDTLAGNRAMELEFSSFLIEADAGFAEMKKGFWDATPKDLDLQLVTPAHTYRGYFRLTEMSHEAPVGEATTVSFSLKSIGAVVET